MPLGRIQHVWRRLRLAALTVGRSILRNGESLPVTQSSCLRFGSLRCTVQPCLSVLRRSISECRSRMAMAAEFSCANDAAEPTEGRVTPARATDSPAGGHRQSCDVRGVYGSASPTTSVLAEVACASRPCNTALARNTGCHDPAFLGPNAAPETQIYRFFTFEGSSVPDGDASIGRET
jgi:hypothetical protein